MYYKYVADRELRLVSLMASMMALALPISFLFYIIFDGRKMCAYHDIIRCDCIMWRKRYISRYPHLTPAEGKMRRMIAE